MPANVLKHFLHRNEIEEELALIFRSRELRKPWSRAGRLRHVIAPFLMQARSFSSSFLKLSSTEGSPSPCASMPAHTAILRERDLFPFPAEQGSQLEQGRLQRAGSLEVEARNCCKARLWPGRSLTASFPAIRRVYRRCRWRTPRGKYVVAAQHHSQAMQVLQFSIDHHPINLPAERHDFSK